MNAQPANFRPEHRLRWPLLEGLLPFDKARLGPDIMAGIILAAIGSSAPAAPAWKPIARRVAPNRMLRQGYVCFLSSTLSHAVSMSDEAVSVGKRLVRTAA